MANSTHNKVTFGGARLRWNFDFDGVEYNVREVYFWNYFGEQYYVD